MQAQMEEKKREGEMRRKKESREREEKGKPRAFGADSGRPKLITQGR